MRIIVSTIVNTAFCLLFSNRVNAQDFPTWISNHYTSAIEIANEDTLIVRSDNFTIVGDLVGIEAFTSLRYLDISGCNNGYGDFSISATLPATLKTFICRGMGYGQILNYYPSVQLGLDNVPAGLEKLDCRGSRIYSLPATLPPGLKVLNCGAIWITEFTPALPATLDSLFCDHTGFTYQGPSPLPPEYYGFPSLPAIPPGLKYLDCSYSKLNALPALPSTLTYLNCSNSKLSALPALPSILTYLNCSANWNTTQGGPGITILPALPPGLIYLDASQNMLTGIPSLPPTLTYLNTSQNDYLGTGSPGYMPLPGALTYFNCSNNGLYSLPTFPNGVRELWIDGNRHIQTLVNLPDSLRYLACYYDSLTELPPLPSKLCFIAAQNTQITCLPHLPDSMGGFVPSNFFNGNNLNVHNITCLPNFVNGMRISAYIPNVGYVTELPLCTPINNNYQCHGAPYVSGHVFYDNNNNGIKDANEYYAPDVRLQFSNGSYSHSNSAGYYELGGGLGVNTLTTSPPAYFTSVPAAPTFNFSSYDTTVTQEIALQATASVDSFKISITPIDFARPGFPLNYFIQYQNIGSTTVAPHIDITYDNTKLDYNSSSNTGVINNVNVLSLTDAPFVPGQPSGNFTVNFTVKPTTAIGSLLFSQATLTANSSVATDSSNVTVRGSFDPNDKQATPVLTTQEVADGDYIDYLIRFQNTGTDTAFNIVLTDTLSGFLDAASLKMIVSSHPCKITGNGNTIAFEFLNIKLVDSNTNQLGSHGFVRFKVKPVSTVVAGTVIPNGADIYFDYNAPVLTNIATTDILNLIPLKLLSFRGLVNTSNKSALLSWTTANEFNTASFDIERSNNGVDFEKVGNIAAYGNGDRSYTFRTTMQNNVEYYRLKMIDVDAKFAYSEIVKLVLPQSVPGLVVRNNPVSNGILTIELTDLSLVNTEAVIINNAGTVINRFALTGGIQNIDLRKISSGIYYLRTKAGTDLIFVN